MNLHIIDNLHNLTNYIFAGGAVITLHNEDTDRRFTFKISRGKKNKELFYVYVLTQPDNVNNKHYKFLGGYSVAQGYKHSTKSTISNEALSVKTIAWFFRKIQTKELFLPQYSKVKVYHIGVCGRCGRAITTPDSLKTGYGSTCLQIQINEGNYIVSDKDIPVQTTESEKPTLRWIQPELFEEISQKHTQTL